MLRNRKIFFPALFTLLVPVMVLSGCAKIGSPVGGEKDVTPPRYVGGEPENRSTRFAEKEINFTFDEYIQFKDLNKELLISPPMDKKPDIQVRDRSVRIKLKSDLLPATTYTLGFGNSITDLNEGNPVRDFEYVFATGEDIDSLSLTGSALNAFDHKPLKDAQVIVMLYDRFGDSIPMVEIPRYIGLVNKDGLFSVNNLRADTFRVLAVNDLNNNLKYDRGDEEVAFLDSPTVISALTVKPVQFIKDTVKVALPEKEEVRAGKKVLARQAVDTTVVQGKRLNAFQVSLLYFSEVTDKVYLTGRKRDIPERLLFTFNRKPAETVKLGRPGISGAAPWFLEEGSITGDTLTYWITDTTLIKNDTLEVMLTYATTDSTGQPISRTDTLGMRYQKAQERSNAGRKSRAALVRTPERKLNLTPSTPDKGTKDLNNPFLFTAEKPLEGLDPSRMELFVIRDSTESPGRFEAVRDSINQRRFTLHTNWVENTNYRLVLWPGAVRDIYGSASDTTEIRFVTQKSDFYGRLLLTATGRRYPVIVELYNEKQQLAGRQILREPGRITYAYLAPARYSVKAIADLNGNGRWDTGDYLQHRQPEPVYMYSLPVVLRSNWDVEINWDIPD